MNSAKNCTSQIMLASVAGVLCGMVLGFLFAPQKGRETRNKLFASANKLSKLKRQTEFPDSEMEMDAINGDLFSRQGTVK